MENEAATTVTKNYFQYFILSAIVLVISLACAAYLVYQKHFAIDSANLPALSPTQIVLTTTPVPEVKEIRLESKDNPDYVRIFSVKSPADIEVRTALVPDGNNDKLIINYKQSELTIRTIYTHSYDKVNERVKGASPDREWSDLVQIESSGGFADFFKFYEITKITN